MNISKAISSLLFWIFFLYHFNSFTTQAQQSSIISISVESRNSSCFQWLGDKWSIPFFVNSIYTEAFSRHLELIKISCRFSKTWMKCLDTNAITEWAPRRCDKPENTWALVSLPAVRVFTASATWVLAQMLHKHTRSQSPKDSYRMWKKDEEEAEQKIPEHSETLWIIEMSLVSILQNYGMSFCNPVHVMLYIKILRQGSKHG